MANRKTPTSVVFKPKAFATIKVIALESRRSIAWTVADLVDMVLAQPHIEEKAQEAARVILSVEPTNPHARVVLGQILPTTSATAQVEPEADKQPARIQQPIFRLEAPAPANDLPIRTRGARPAQLAPTPAEDAPEPGNSRPARGLLFG